MSSISDLLNGFFNAMKQTDGAVIAFVILGVVAFVYFIFKK